jgi:hypothetical protein
MIGTAGLPPTVAPGATSRVTPLWPPIRAPSPIDKMSGDPDLPADGDEITQLAGRAGDAGLRRNDTVPAHHDVVGDLHQIINHRAGADNRVRPCAAINGAELAPISTSSPMITRPSCGIFTKPDGSGAKPNPSWPMRARRDRA